MIELIGNLIGIVICLFIIASPFVMAFIIIKELLKKAKRKNNIEIYDRGPYGTGWTWNEKTQRWDPPKNIRSEIKIHRTGPTYEEWKAEKEKKEIDFTPQNSNTEQGTYRYDYFHIPDEQQHYAKPREQAPKKEPIPKRKTGYEEAYEAVPILTYNESRNFRTLKEAADQKGLMICPKVRLADIVSPRKGSDYYSRFGKIKSKHVDFTICDYNMKVIAVVELDDSSHDRPDRQERDEFVDSILESNGIKVIHTRHVTPDILDNL